MTTVIWDLK